MKTLTQQYLEKNALVPVEDKLLEAMQSLFGEGMVTNVFTAIPIYSDETPERFEQRKANALVYWNFSSGEQLAIDHSNLVVCLSNGKSIVIEHSESFCMRSLELDINRTVFPLKIKYETIDEPNGKLIRIPGKPGFVFTEEMFSKSLMEFVNRRPSLYVEYGKPNLNNLSIHDAEMRMRTIDEQRVCAVINPRSLSFRNNELIGTFKPCGPYGNALRDNLSNDGTGFAIRAKLSTGKDGVSDRLDIFSIDFVSNPIQRVELTLPELLAAIAGNSRNKTNDNLSLKEGLLVTQKYLDEMEAKINARSLTPVDGYLPASEIIGKGAQGYVHPDYKKLVQNFARDLGISIYKE